MAESMSRDVSLTVRIYVPYLRLSYIGAAGTSVARISGLGHRVGHPSGACFGGTKLALRLGWHSANTLHISSHDLDADGNSPSRAGR